MKQKQKLNNFHFLRKREWQLGFLSFFFGHLLFRIGQSFLNNITLSMYFLMSFWSSHKRNLLPCGCLQELILISDQL